jgi:NAD(P)-dependent dehydrogenase (short-subunit alcohol dehydrogenase family)
VTTPVPLEKIHGPSQELSLASRGRKCGARRDEQRGVPNPPSSFELLDLDITSDASVIPFVSALLSHPATRGRIDILINNAGRVESVSPGGAGRSPRVLAERTAALIRR